jgi:RNA polymerase sigma factor (sigma-70 family)
VVGPFFRHRSVEMAVTEQSARATRALDDLYRHHAAEIFRYAYAVLGNHADAEDVTQATFMNALRALERGEVPRKPSNWLIVIAHNLIRQRFRQAQVRPAEVELNDELARAAPQPDGDDTPSVDEVVKALGRIPPSQREAIVMREFEGRAYAEIAEILGITTSALETLLFRARRSLADELENVVTCVRAEESVSRLLDGRLSRREKRRLLEHVRSCPSCARFEAIQHKQRRALKALALLPLPASLTLFKGVHGASAAGLPTIGAAATAGGGAATGGFAIGGLAVTGATKVAAVVTAVVVAGSVGYEGVIHSQTGAHKNRPPAAAQAAKNRGAAHTVGTARKPRIAAITGRHHVPGGPVDVTGTPNEKGKGGGPASGNAKGGATRAHGAPSGKTANGRGAGATKRATAPVKHAAKLKTKTTLKKKTKLKRKARVKAKLRPPAKHSAAAGASSGSSRNAGNTSSATAAPTPVTTVSTSSSTQPAAAPTGNANGADNGTAGGNASSDTGAPAAPDHGNGKK